MLDHYAQTVPRRDALRPTAPQAVRNAAWVMYTGAVAALVLVVVEFVTAQATKTALGHRYPSLSARDLAAVARFTVISEAVVALIVAVLFVWVARRCLDGKNWARITATVLGALGTLDAFLALTVAHLHAGHSTADLIVGFVIAGIGLVSICILWLRSSNAYFRQVGRTGV
jgi:hypothetical protein